MGEPDSTVSTEPTGEAHPDNDLPPGDHPVEVAARKGIGPLSPLGREVWHGHAVPCVSCGQLVERDEPECDYCAQDLSSEMVERMRAHAGPWYVLEHVRPFPGVTLERIIRQIRRGLLTATSIVRGPATDFQWRFAAETPGLCRFFGRCWSCYDEVPATERRCPNCHSALTFKRGRAELGKSAGAVEVAESVVHEGEAAQTAADPTLAAVDAAVDAAPEPCLPDLTSELAALSAAVHEADVPVRSVALDAPARVGRVPASLIALVMVTAVIVGLTALSQCRGQTDGLEASPTVAPVDS